MHTKACIPVGTAADEFSLPKLKNSYSHLLHTLSRVIGQDANLSLQMFHNSKRSSCALALYCSLVCIALCSIDCTQLRSLSLQFVLLRLSCTLCMVPFANTSSCNPISTAAKSLACQRQKHECSATACLHRVAKPGLLSKAIADWEQP